MGTKGTVSSSGGHLGGCLKCGQPGHWARDCKVLASQRDSHPNIHISSAITATTKLIDHNNDAEDGTDPKKTRPETEENIKVQEENVLKTAAEKQKRKRPKVTYDLLKTNAGLPDVYHNFRMLYGESFRGKGHETSDLRRLLELYNRWQTRIFPGWPFDRFIDGVEKLSHSHIVKTELQDMRVDLLKVVTEAYKLPGHLTSDSDIKNDHHDTGADREEELNAELPDEDDQLLAMIARNGYGDSDDEEFGKYDGENKKEEYSNDEDDEILQMLAAEENYMDDEFGNDQGNTTSVPEN